MASATIIVPCYNEELRLNVAAFRNFDIPSHEIRFLFVDDGSTDGTAALLEALRASDPRRFAVLNLQPNQGKAEAVRQGLVTAIRSQREYVGFWDADLATPLGAISDFLDLAETRPELELVMGARVKLLGRKVERRATRHYAGRVFATVVSTMLGLPVYDTQCGAKLFRMSPSIHTLFDTPFVSRWIFDVEILARLIQCRRGKQLSPIEKVVYEFPLLEWKDIPGSKLAYGDFFRAAFELAQIYKQYF